VSVSSLSEEPVVDFLIAVKATRDNFAVQQRRIAVLSRLDQQFQTEHIVLSSHGNLLVMMLHYLDRTIDFNFWKSMTPPDICKLKIRTGSMAGICRLWDEELLP